MLEKIIAQFVGQKMAAVMTDNMSKEGLKQSAGLGLFFLVAELIKAIHDAFGIDQSYAIIIAWAVFLGIFIILPARTKDLVVKSLLNRKSE